MEKVKKALADCIRTERMKMRMTQAQLAEKIGVRMETVGTWEHGSAVPGFDKVVALARILKIKIDPIIKQANL